MNIDLEPTKTDWEATVDEVKKIHNKGSVCSCGGRRKLTRQCYNRGIDETYWTCLKCSEPGVLKTLLS